MLTILLVREKEEKERGRNRKSNKGEEKVKEGGEEPIYEMAHLRKCKRQYALSIINMLS